MTLRFIAIAGSVKETSINRRLLAVATQAVIDAGAEVNVVNLLDYPFPVFSEDEEANEIPENITKFKALIRQTDGYLIASPEYNGSLTPLLINTIAWLSRKHGDEPRMEAFTGKVAAVMSASPGGLGGIRALPHLRYVLEGIGVLIIPEMLTLGNAHSAFEDDGTLKDEKFQERVDAMAQNLVRVTSKLQS